MCANACVCAYVCVWGVCVRESVYVRVFVCVCACACVCMCVCVHARTHVCVGI